MKNFTKILFSLLLLVSFNLAKGQVKIGDNVTTVNSNAVLELEATNKGVLMPRVDLVALTDPAPLSSHVAGMVVFNKDAFGSAVKSGYYYNNGFKWVFMGESSSILVQFDTSNPNNIGTQFTPIEPSNSENVYVSSIDGLYWKYDDSFSSYISFTPDPSTEWYLNNTTVDASMNKNLPVYRTGGVGVGVPLVMDSSAILEANSRDKGFLPPRLTKVERDNISNPATGLLIYCTDCNAGGGCLVYNYGTTSQPLWECLGEPKGAIVSVDCAGSSINGNYVKDVPNTAANTVTIKIDNNTFTSIAPNLASYLTLSGNSSGLTVTGPVPASPTIPAGGSQIYTYTITGTPTISGSLNARFAGNGLVCEKTTTVLSASVIPNCSGAFVFGLAPIKFLKNGTTYTAGTVSIPYTSTQNIAYGALSVVINGLTFSRVAGTYTAPSGFVEYTITGTYTGANCTSITANLPVYNDTCSVVVGEGQSIYTNGVYVASSNGFNNTCPATQAGLTDSSFSSGWASPGGAANQYVEISFPTMNIRSIVLSGGPVTCWGANASYISYHSNLASLQLEYWNGSAWVGAGAVPTLFQNKTTTMNIACDVITTNKLRIRNNNANWWGLGTFYPVGYWDSNVIPPSLNCSTPTISLTPAGGLINGQIYTGTVTVGYTSTASAVYGAETISRSGLTLTRISGTMVNGSASITYNVSGSYTGISYNTQDFPISLFGASCNVTLGKPTDFKTGSYTSSNSGFGGTCTATQAGMTDASYTTGWASPNTTANQTIIIDFGTTKAVKSVVASGGPVACWGANAQWVSAYANTANIKFEYWNGSAWVAMLAVSNNLTQNSLTTYTLTTPVVTTKIRAINLTATWWGLGTFYPITY